jgi:hypothetical protein
MIDRPFPAPIATSIKALNFASHVGAERRSYVSAAALNSRVSNDVKFEFDTVNAALTRLHSSFDNY